MKKRKKKVVALACFLHYVYKQKFSVQKKVVTGATTLLAIYIHLGQILGI